MPKNLSRRLRRTKMRMGFSVILEIIVLCLSVGSRSRLGSGGRVTIMGQRIAYLIVSERYGKYNTRNT